LSGSLNFDGAVNDDAYGMLPVYTEMSELSMPGLELRYETENPVFAVFSDQEQMTDIADIDLVNHSLQYLSEKVVISGKTYAVFKLLPLRINPETGLIEKLVAFDLVPIPLIGEPQNLKSVNNFAEKSPGVLKPILESYKLATNARIKTINY